jgi:hypothetical protein
MKMEAKHLPPSPPRDKRIEEEGKEGNISITNNKNC